MPYIPKNKQEQYDQYINIIVNMIHDNGKVDYGALEYVIFSMLQRMSNDEQSRRFNNMNALIGVLETTKAEVLRRILGPYEDLKLIDNWNEK